MRKDGDSTEVGFNFLYLPIYCSTVLELEFV